MPQRSKKIIYASDLGKHCSLRITFGIIIPSRKTRRPGVVPGPNA
nr:MAG TPA: hypothetical protein [Caudoviricetes sp.]